ncbi:SRPBCC family protein [Luteipulveratus flavus]|uniref:SRPBCC family protein n=1 Tax=Luteipulveratus flavus TaxID=3031728 RepID=A0ABT6CA67_9MICO|nr:SRPBCC family protein [Luteipulveratus sp. YIM 133296]MDF8265790.1 SRPBCC family protein [Luteipulveratus sp. YIM 133296]
MAERTQSSIDVSAAPETVLDVIADFERYPDWAGQVKSAKVLVEDTDGWADEVEFVLDAGVIKDTYTLGYTWEVDEDGTGTVSWTLVKATLLKALDGAYTLTSDGSGGTRVGYELAVDVSLPMLGVLKRKAEKVIIDTALKELKKRAEA